MTSECEQLLAAALKRVSVDGSFSPSEIGLKIGLSKPQAESAARSLSNAGILVLGFDSSAHFSSDYRKLRKNDRKPEKSRGRRAKAARV